MADVNERYARAEARLFARYDLDVRTRWLDIADPACRLRVLETGPQQAPPLLFLHGAGASGSHFAPLWGSLDANAYRLIAVDLPGMGANEAFDYRRHDLRDLGRRTLRAIIGALTDRGSQDADAALSIVANSYGGMVALWLAADEPALVANILCLGCPAVALQGVKANLPLAMMSIPGLNRVAVRAMRMLPQRFARRSLRPALGRTAADRADDDFVAVFLDTMALPGYAVTMPSLMEKILRFGRPRPELALDTADMARLVTPVLIAWGDDDFEGPCKLGRDFVDQLPNGRVVPVEGGHSPWIDDPNRCASLVEDFFDATGGTSPIESTRHPS